MQEPSRHAVQLALDALSEDELMVVILAVRSDLTYQEIARVIGASERVVLRSIHSGLCRLAAELSRQSALTE